MRFHLTHLHFHTPFSTLLPHQLSRTAKELFASVGILGFAISAATLFEPIYLYTLGYSFSQIVFYNVITYALYLLLIPFGAKFVLRYGYELGIALGSLILIVYYLAVFSIPQFPALFYVAPVLFTLHKIFYWMGYHGDFARSSDRSETGRELGEISFIIGLVTIFGPVAGGAVASAFGFRPLFLIVAILILISNIPLFRVRVQEREKTIPYDGALRLLKEPVHRRRFFASFGYGEDFIALVFLPLFIYSVVQGAAQVGIIVTFSSLVTALVLLYIGKLTDDKNPNVVLRLGVLAKTLLWLVLIPVRTAFQYFFADAGFRIARGATEYPLLTETYNAARETDVMKVVVLYETGLIVGKLLAMVALLILFQTSLPVWTSMFVLGACLSVFYAFFRHHTIMTNYKLRITKETQKNVS